MKRIIALLLCAALALPFWGCTDGIMHTQPSETLLATGGQDDSYDDRLTEEAVYAMLFDIRNRITLRLDMDEAELAKMQADFDRYDRNGGKSPIYRMGQLEISITTPDGSDYRYTIHEVGVRMKGNTSRTDFYSREDGIYNIIHLKLSFQETFDDPQYYGADAKVWDETQRAERKNRTFATLEKLDLRWNRCDDSTYLKEYFAYATYREYGVPAPHTNLASFDWAGIHMGVFTINEPIDDVFIAKNFPEEAQGGDLYKIGWAGYSNGSFTSTQSIGIEDEAAGEFYAYDLKTNKKTSGHEALTKLIRELNSSSVSKEKFGQLVDTASYLPYCAVSYLLGNPDDLRNNYNNCYLYFREDTGQAVIIPYDFDRCLGITAHWNPTGDGVTSDNPFSTSLLATGQDQESPLMRFSVTAGGHYVREYAAILGQIQDGSWFTYENFRSIYEIAEANYSALTAPEKDFHNTRDLHLSFDLERTSDFSANENICIREYLQAKLETLDGYLKNVDQYADAQLQVKAEWYIRSDFTNWQNDERYAMTEEDGIVSIHLTLSRESWLKIYNDNTRQWYGTECINEDCPVSYRTDDHTNIILPKGNYLLRIDPETEEITIELE